MISLREWLLWLLLKTNTRHNNAREGETQAYENISDYTRTVDKKSWDDANHFRIFFKSKINRKKRPKYGKIVTFINSFDWMKHMPKSYANIFADQWKVETCFCLCICFFFIYISDLKIYPWYRSIVYNFWSWAAPSLKLKRNNIIIINLQLYVYVLHNSAPVRPTT